jgi:hypothetical protein
MLQSFMEQPKKNLNDYICNYWMPHENRCIPRSQTAISFSQFFSVNNNNNINNNNNNVNVNVNVVSLVSTSVALVYQLLNRFVDPGIVCTLLKFSYQFVCDVVGSM